MAVGSNDVTMYLNRWKGGDEASRQELLDRIDPNLRRMLADRLKRRGNVANRFRPTELLPAVHDRLNKQRQAKWANRDQLFGVISGFIGFVIADAIRFEERKCRDWRKEVPLEQEGQIALQIQSGLDLEFQSEVRLALENLSAAHPLNYELLMQYAVDEVPLADLARQHGSSEYNMNQKLLFARSYLATHTHLCRPRSPINHRASRPV